MTAWSDEALAAEQKQQLPLATADLTGKVVIVTGANQGLGLETVKHLTPLKPAKIILACRIASNGEEAIKAIQAEMDTSNVAFEVWTLDQADFGSVKAFAERAQSLERLDIFVANAGVLKLTKELTKDGFETSIQVNNISTAYLASRLLPIMQATAKTHPDTDFKPHISLVTSSLHLHITSFDKTEEKGILATLNERPLEVQGNVQARYRYSKAINVLDAKALSKLAGPSVIVNSVNPGICKSNLAREVPEALRPQLQARLDALGWSTEMGSRNLLWAALSDTPSGGYVSGCEVKEPSDLAISPEGSKVAAEIWEEYQKIWKDHGLI